MNVILKSTLSKRALMLLEIVGVATLMAWILKAYVADVITRKPSAKNLEFAVRLDPGNADYHFELGRLFQYSVADIDPSRAVEHLKRATELNPNAAKPWLELGTALDLQGKIAEAEACMRQADFLAPNLPSFQWSIGNFFLLHGNLDEAFRHFNVVLAGTEQYNQILFDTAWRASGDNQKILDQLIPHHVTTEFSYLYYLLSQRHFSEAQSVWMRIASSSESFLATQVAGYLESLVGAHRPAEAYQVWSDLRRKGLIKATYEETDQNLIINGDFEEEILNMGFDWHIVPAEGVYCGLDQTTYHSPSHALLVQFSGNRNVSYRNVYELVRLVPGRSYRLRGFMKTAKVTTDSGPRLAVWDAYDPAALNKFSEGLTESTTGWTQVMLDFTTGPKTELIAVGLIRFQSQKLDNLIAGKVWVDDLSLVPLAKGEPRSE